MDFAIEGTAASMIRDAAILSARVADDLVTSEVISELGNRKVKRAVLVLAKLIFVYAMQSNANVLHIDEFASTRGIFAYSQAAYDVNLKKVLRSDGLMTDTDSADWTDYDNLLAEFFNCCRKHCDYEGKIYERKLIGAVAKGVLYASLAIPPLADKLDRSIQREYGYSLGDIEDNCTEELDVEGLVIAVGELMENVIDNS